MKIDKSKVSVFLHNNRNYDSHFLMSALDPHKHGNSSCVPKTTEQYISFTIGNLVFKDSMQFMGKSLDDLVKTLNTSDLKITKDFLRKYVKRISTNPELLDDETLGLYKKEVADETYEAATEEKRNARMAEKRKKKKQKQKEKKKKKTGVVSDEPMDVDTTSDNNVSEPMDIVPTNTAEISDPCSSSTSSSSSSSSSSFVRRYASSNEFLDDTVTVEDDNGEDEDYNEEETESDREFLDDGDEPDDDELSEEYATNTNIDLHRMLDNAWMRADYETDDDDSVNGSSSSSDDSSSDESSEEEEEEEDDDEAFPPPPPFTFPEEDYRSHPYVPPELNAEEEELFNELFALLQTKGVFPYEYITSLDKLNETKLPEIKHFHSKLTGEGIKEEQHKRAQNVFTKFRMNSLWQYMILYLITDVTLLADVLVRFKKLCIDKYGIDPFHSLTTPGFSWQAMLKMTKADIDLLSAGQKDLYQFFEAAKRGGFSVINNRRLKANIPHRDGYDSSQKPSWIMYLDANNLYGE